MKLVYTDLAVLDLRRLRAFIETTNPATARRVANEIVEHIGRLPRFPRLGHPVELAPDPQSVRDLIFGPYVVRYSIHKATIAVLRVWERSEGNSRR